MKKKIYCNLANILKYCIKLNFTSIILPHDDDEAHSVVFHNLSHTYVCMRALIFFFSIPKVNMSKE